MMRRNNIDDGEVLRWVSSRSQTAVAIVSATARRRAVFAMMPTGLEAGASSDMTSSIPVKRRESAPRSRRSGYVDRERCGGQRTPSVSEHASHYRGPLQCRPPECGEGRIQADERPPWAPEPWRRRLHLREQTRLAAADRVYDDPTYRVAPTADSETASRA